MSAGTSPVDGRLVVILKVICTLREVDLATPTLVHNRSNQELLSEELFVGDRVGIIIFRVLKE